jgi:GT2 family glycosyltransferase
MSNQQGMNLNIAILLTCYNRLHKTIQCLNTIQTQLPVPGITTSIYLVDDGSPDQTGDIVKNHFPSVHVIKGNGQLFWVGGMRTAWQAALQNQFDAYLLLNDDVELEPGALQKLAQLFKADCQSPKKTGIYIGSTFDKTTKATSYGGRRLTNRLTGETVLLDPDDNVPVSCDLAHANILLVSQQVVEAIGILSERFTQRLADYDYTLMARKKGFQLVIAPGYYGSCTDDHGVNWLPQSASLKQRISYLKDPRHLAFSEYMYYMCKHFPLYVPVAFTKLWLKTLFPVLWSTLKRTASS